MSRKLNKFSWVVVGIFSILHINYVFAEPGANVGVVKTVLTLEQTQQLENLKRDTFAVINNKLNDVEKYVDDAKDFPKGNEWYCEVADLKCINVAKAKYFLKWFNDVYITGSERLLAEAKKELGNYDESANLGYQLALAETAQLRSEQPSYDSKIDNETNFQRLKNALDGLEMKLIQVEQSSGNADAGMEIIWGVVLGLGIFAAFYIVVPIVGFIVIAFGWLIKSLFVAVRPYSIE